MRPLTPRRIAWICAGLAAILFVIVVFSLKVGAYPIDVADVAMTLIRGAIGHWSSIPPSDKLIVFGLRLPRIALGVLVGAALSVSGASFQALLRNPLADPYVLGVSSGAALGAICSLAWFPHRSWTMQLFAFLAALLTIAVVYFLGRRGGQLDSTTLLLSGIIAATFLSAVIMFLMTTLSGRDLRGVAFWLMGDLATPPALRMRFLFIVLLLAIGAIYTTASDLNLMLTGEREAHHLGVNVARVKFVVYVGASLLTGLAVSVSGAIGYVGLLIPHVIRLMFGSDYRLLIPASAIGGAIAVTLADTLARTIVAPTELPVGAMTAVIGAPVFIYLLRRRLA